MNYLDLLPELRTLIRFMLTTQTDRNMLALTCRTECEASPPRSILFYMALHGETHVFLADGWAERLRQLPIPVLSTFWHHASRHNKTGLFEALPALLFTGFGHELWACHQCAPVPDSHRLRLHGNVCWKDGCHTIRVACGIPGCGAPQICVLHSRYFLLSCCSRGCEVTALRCNQHRHPQFRVSDHDPLFSCCKRCANPICRTHTDHRRRCARCERRRYSSDSDHGGEQ